MSRNDYNKPHSLYFMKRLTGQLVQNSLIHTFSNLTSALTATDAAASDLLFHPANFLNVDENEDTSTKPTETDVLLEIESEESAEQVCSFNA